MAQDMLGIGVIGVVRYNPLFLKAGPGETSMVVGHPTEYVKQSVEAEQGRRIRPSTLPVPIEGRQCGSHGDKRFPVFRFIRAGEIIDFVRVVFGVKQLFRSNFW